MKKIDLTQGKVVSVLVALALPIMASSVLQLTYNLVDMLLVGRLGSDAVASIGTSSFLIGVANAIQACIVISTGILVSHAIGRKDEEEQSKYLSTGFCLNLLFGLFFALFVIWIGKPFISFLNVQNEWVELQGYAYLVVSSPMLIFSFFNFWYTRVFNSFGQNKMALKISAIGVVLNIMLDPLFIYTFKLGVLGAGLATLIANVVMTLCFYIKSKQLFQLDLTAKYGVSTYLKMIRLGLPMSSQRLLFTLVSIFLAKMITSFGTEAIAAQKIGLQIESITYMVIGGLNGAIASFVGQNYGAKNFNRIKEGVRVAIIIGLLYALLTTVLFLVFPKSLARCFVTDRQTIEITANYLRIVGLTQVFMAIEIIFNGAFVGLGMPKIPATISIVFTAARIPMAWLFTQWMGVNGIWLSISVSMVLKGILAAYVYYKKGKEGIMDVAAI